MLRTIPLLLVALLLAGCRVFFIPVPVPASYFPTPTPEATAVAVEPTMLMLEGKPLADYMPTLKDMPAGFLIQQEGISGTNADIAKSMEDPVAAEKSLNELGRQGGYYRHFAPTGLQIAGNGLIAFSLISFETEEGASKSLPLYIERDRFRFGKLSEIAMPDLGDESVAHFARWEDPNEGGSSPRQIDEHIFVIRKGNVLLFVEGSSFANAGNVNELVALAELVVNRLP